MKSAMRAVLLALVVVGGLSVPRPSPAMVEGFYNALQAELAGPPGSIIRIEPWPVQGIYRARILRILYRSLDPGGRTIAVSGSVIIPEFVIPPGGRRIVAWARPQRPADGRRARQCLSDRRSGEGRALELGNGAQLAGEQPHRRADLHRPGQQRQCRESLQRFEGRAANGCQFR